MAVNQQELSDNLKNSQVKPKHPGGRPTKYNTVTVRKAREYLQGKFKSVPTIAGLCVALGVTRETIYQWIKDENKKEFSDTIALMPEIKEELLIHKSLIGEFNSNVSKLLLASDHGYDGEAKRDSGITVNVDRGRVAITQGNQTVSVDTEVDVTPVIEHE